MTTLDRPYCSLEDVQKETRNSDNENSEWYRTCINRASRWVEDYTRRVFRFQDKQANGYTVRERDIAGDCVYLPWPVITVDSVAVDGVTVPSADYVYYAGDRFIRLRAGDWPSTHNMVVKGTFGYGASTDTSTDVPSDLPASVRRACIIVAGAWSHEKRREVVTPEGDTTSLLDERIPDEAKQLLNRWRTMPV
jgi:hypothetical protein